MFVVRFRDPVEAQSAQEANYEQLSPEVRDAFDAYAAGVNAWMGARSGALPPEFLLLGVKPEPWRPADSLVWGRIMAMKPMSPSIDANMRFC